ncbi:MAG TPA: hypothetical protein G4O18_00720 [Dehalococcoidia bacterium]|nr:hypothetical protein [Dehalococcoidia bacterium]
MSRLKYLIGRYSASIVTGLGVAWLLGLLISVFIPGATEVSSWVWPAFVAGAIILAIGRLLAIFFPRKGGR